MNGMKELLWGCTVVICGMMSLLAGLLSFMILLLLLAVGGYGTDMPLLMFVLALAMAVAGALMIKKGKIAVNTAALIEKTRNKD